MLMNLEKINDKLYHFTAYNKSENEGLSAHITFFDNEIDESGDVPHYVWMKKLKHLFDTLSVAIEERKLDQKK